jgi:AAA+ superfamily predicted ATPase
LNYNKALPELKKNGMTLCNMNFHMVFTGTPGTAKTTVARLLGQIFKENNILSVGNFYEVGRADIIGEYVGQTAVKVKKLFAKAKGSILFIDEPYSIVNDGGRSFVPEAISTIVQQMENLRNDIIVIFAGYPNEMETFKNQNPGLKSRIGYTLNFVDYKADELVQIAEKLFSEAGFVVEPDALSLIEDICDSASNQINFGNGRFVRNMVETIILHHVYQIKSWENISKEEASTIKASDIEVETFPHRVLVHETSSNNRMC